MLDALFKFKVANLQELIDLVNDEAQKYCAYSSAKRQQLACRSSSYICIELWDGRFITATMISTFAEHDLHEIEDIVLMDGTQIRTAIESRLMCLEGNLKFRFATHNDYGDLTDILLWEITKSS